MSHTRRIGDVLVTAACAPGQETLLDDVFTMLERLAPLRAGMRIRFGWSMLTLKPHQGGLVVCEPDFNGDAMRDVRPRVDVTLDVIARQVIFLRSVGAAPADVAYDQFCVTAGAALSARVIHLHRDVADAPDDSGWRLSPVGDDASNEPAYEAERVCMLVPRRPAILTVLALPVGFSVVFEADDIRVVIDENKRDRLAGDRG